MTRHGDAPGRTFSIWVDGRLSDRFAEGFGDVHQHDEASGTVLSGRYVDDAHLSGLLDRLRGLGIPVHRLEVAESSNTIGVSEMNEASTPVQNVAVIEVGRGELHREHMYGTRKPTLWWIFAGRERVTVPLNVFVIEHADSLILFDTGPSQSLVTDPAYWPDRVTKLFMRGIFRFHIGPEDTLAKQLERAGYRTADVTTAVLSHLHFDHVGGIGDIPDAQLLAAPEAWEHMMGTHPEREAVLRRDIDVPGADWKLIEFQPTDDPGVAPFTELYDVTGDGSVVVIPTPGHLPGSVSMLIRRSAAPPVLLVGDLTYSEELLMRDQVPATGDRDLLLQSFAKVRALKQHTPDLVIIASHDTTAADKLASAVGGGQTEPNGAPS